MYLFGRESIAYLCLYSVAKQSLPAVWSMLLKGGSSRLAALITSPLVGLLLLVQ